VSLLWFLAIAFGTAAVSLLTRRSFPISTTVGLLGLVGALVAALSMPPLTTVAVGGGELAASPYARLFAVLGSAVSLLLVVLGLATATHRFAPGVLLAGIAAAVLALTLPDAQSAVLAATAGGLVGVLATEISPATPRGVLVGVREIRALAVAGSLAVLAAAWIGRPLEELVTEPSVFGLAYLGFVVAVAIRFGAIPFHFWAARLADAAPEVTLPMLLAWGPAAFAVVALTWIDQSVSPLVLPLSAERTLVVLVGVASLVLGTLAAWIQDDLEHVVGYTIIADAGVAILGLAILDASAWQPARTWILVFVMTRSAFAAWAVAMRAAFGTRRVDRLGGWIPRAPILALSLAVIAAASIGWPGFAGWDARATLIAETVGWPLGLLVGLGAIAPLAVYGKLAYVGIGRPSSDVAQGEAERPRWPDPIAAPPAVALSPLQRTVARGGDGATRVLTGIASVPIVLQANRTPIAAVVVLLLAALSFSVAAGGLGVAAAAGAAPGPQFGPNEPLPPGASEGSGPEPSSSIAPSGPIEGSSAPPNASSGPTESGPSFEPLPAASSPAP
jgi:hypothetical protein